MIGPLRAATTISKGASQPGPTALIDRFGALPGRAGARQLLNSGSAGVEGEGGGGEQRQRDRDQHRRQGGPAQGGVGGGGDAGAAATGPPGADRARVDPLAEQREKGRQGDPGDRDGDRGDDDERGRQREQQRPRLQERGEEDRGEEHRAREHSRATRGPPGCPRRLPGRGPARQLLAEAGDDEERVVDPEGEAHHRADDHREGFDRHEGVEQDEDAAAGEHGEGAEGERDQGGDERAEDEQQDDQEQRRGDQLGALGRRQRFGLQGPRDACIAGLDRFERGMGAPLQGAFEARHGAAHRHVEGQVVVEQDDRPAGPGAQVADRASVPGGDDGDRGVAT